MGYLEHPSGALPDVRALGGVIQVGLPMPEAINVRKIDKQAPSGTGPKLKLVT
jgi:hypothetical protein